MKKAILALAVTTVPLGCATHASHSQIEDLQRQIRELEDAVQNEGVKRLHWDNVLARETDDVLRRVLWCFRSEVIEEESLTLDSFRKAVNDAFKVREYEREQLADWLYRTQLDLAESSHIMAEDLLRRLRAEEERHAKYLGDCDEMLKYAKPDQIVGIKKNKLIAGLKLGVVRGKIKEVPIHARLREQCLAVRAKQLEELLKLK